MRGTGLNCQMAVGTGVFRVVKGSPVQHAQATVFAQGREVE